MRIEPLEFRRKEKLKISISRDVMLCSQMFSDISGDHATFIFYPVSIGLENFKSRAKKNFPDALKTKTRFVYPRSCLFIFEAWNSSRYLKIRFLHHREHTPSPFTTIGRFIQASASLHVAPSDRNPPPHSPTHPFKADRHSIPSQYHNISDIVPKTVIGL